MLTPVERKQKESNKALLIDCLQNADLKQDGQAVMFGKQLDFVVANFLRKGFVLAGTDTKFKKLSNKEALMCDEGNTVVIISESNVFGYSTCVEVRHY